MLGTLLVALLYLPPNPTVSPLWEDWRDGFWNIGRSEQTDTNAVAHIWGGAACSLAFNEVLRRFEVKGSPWKSGLICTGLGLGRLFLVHAPKKIAPGYGAEMRAGAITWLGGVWAAATPLLVF